MNLLETVRAVADFNRLALLVTEGPDGQDARWEAVQAWLAANPTYETTVNYCLERPPENAITYLCHQLGLDASLVRALDPQGQIRAMATNTIAQLQILYRERKELNG